MIKNKPEFKIQMVTLTQSSEKYPDLVPASCTGAAHWSSREDVSRTNSTYVQAIILLGTILFDFIS